ncbi:MAG: hypothetical protein AB8B97_06135 [Granulosicoccus sp.]
MKPGIKGISEKNERIFSLEYLSNIVQKITRRKIIDLRALYFKLWQMIARKQWHFKVVPQDAQRQYGYIKGFFSTSLGLITEDKGRMQKRATRFARRGV